LLRGGGPATGSKLPPPQSASKLAHSTALRAPSLDTPTRMRSTPRPLPMNTLLRALCLSSFVLLAFIAQAKAATTISYPQLGLGSAANRTLTGWATIVSDSGPVASGANAPRLYFKRESDADAFVGNTAADNGWKYVTATGGSGGAYSFIIDYSIIRGGSVNEGDGVSFGDTIQYFVVAQDEAGNLVSSPAGAAASANPPVQNISAKPASGVKSYLLKLGIGGTITVPGTFTSITGTEGLCDALTQRPLNGNVTVKIVSDLTEGGAFPIIGPPMANDYPNTCTVTIQPDSATPRTISGSSKTLPSGVTSFLFLAGAQRVIIDGSFGGSGRYLTFRNTNPAGPTFTFRDDASNNTVRNCVIEGAGQTGNQNTEVTSSVVFFGTGLTTGNDNNAITGNQIRDLSDRVGVPADLVGSRAESTTVMNSGNTLSNNELFNFTSFAVNIPFTGSGNGQPSNESWTITGNTIYQTAPRTSALIGISYYGFGTNTIRDNSVRDLTSGGIVCMQLRLHGGSTTVAGNRIWNINSAAVFGIVCEQLAGGSITMVNNTVSLRAEMPQALFGIGLGGLGGSTDGTIFVAHNTVLFTGDGGGGVNTYAFYATQPATVKNNLFLNLVTGGGSHYAAASNTGLALAMDGNVYAGTGSVDAANFFVSAATVSPYTQTPMTFESWRQFVNGDANSNASNPGGDYSSALFVDPANGDFHLAGESPLVIAAGVPLAEVTDDFDGQPRHNAPDIGPDESTTVPQLSSLVLSGVTLAPDFATRTFGYSATVPNLTTATTVTPTAVRPSSTILVNGNAVASGAASGSFALDVGQTTINTVVSGFNGTRVKTYTVFVTRPPSSNANLSSLALSAGTLDPVFASGTLATRRVCPSIRPASP
jgi:hypothetical protein